MRSLLRSSSLDRQLAAGAPYGWSRSVAARARSITTLEHRKTLAENWEHLLDTARRPAPLRTPRVALCRDRILAAESEIHELLAALSEARLESAAGVAAASLLLRNGAGPVYNRRCTTNLGAALDNATRHIRDPITAGAGW